MLNAPAPKMSTIYEIPNQVLKITEKLNLRRTTLAFDQALYAKAVEILWNDCKFKLIVIRMEVFHRLCNLMSAKGLKMHLLLNLNTILKEIDNLDDTVLQHHFEPILKHLSCIKAMDLYLENLRILRYQHRNLSSFWMSCIDIRDDMCIKNVGCSARNGKADDPVDLSLG